METIKSQSNLTTESEPGNTNPVRARRWCMTLNNYSDNEYNLIINELKQKSQYLVIGKEIGEDKKTPHLQGYVEFKNQKKLNELKNINKRIHWEKAKGNRKQNFEYCSKDNKFILHDETISMKLKLKEKCLKMYDNIIWKPWQKAIIETINENPDNRTINWIWEEQGNVGKSFLCKYLAIKYDAIICEGKTNDILNQINIHIENNKEPKVILIDSPRCHENYINYSCIEKVKNGLIYSGKYEGGVCVFPCPHVIVFANHEPNEDKMSGDRWKIINI